MSTSGDVHDNVDDEPLADKDALAERKRHQEAVARQETTSRRKGSTTISSDNSKPTTNPQKSTTDTEPDEHVAKYLRRRRRTARVAALLTLPTIKEGTSNDHNLSSSRPSSSSISDSSTQKPEDRYLDYLRRLQHQATDKPSGAKSGTDASAGSGSAPSSSWQAFLQRMNGSSPDSVSTDTPKEPRRRGRLKIISSEPEKPVKKSETPTTQKPEKVESEKSKTPVQNGTSSGMSKSVEINEPQTFTSHKPDNAIKLSKVAESRPSLSPKSEITSTSHDKRQPSAQSGKTVESEIKIEEASKPQEKLSLFTFSRLKTIFSKKKEKSQAKEEFQETRNSQTMGPLSNNDNKEKKDNSGSQVKLVRFADQNDSKSEKDNKIEARPAWSEKENQKSVSTGDFQTKISKLTVQEVNDRNVSKKEENRNTANLKLPRKGKSPSEPRRSRLLSSVTSLGSSERPEPPSVATKDSVQKSKPDAKQNNGSSKQTTHSVRPIIIFNDDSTEDNLSHQTSGIPRKNSNVLLSPSNAAVPRAKPKTIQPSHPFSVNSQASTQTIPYYSSQTTAMIPPVMMVPPMMYPPHMMPPQMIPPHMMPPHMMAPHMIPPHMIPPHMIPPHMMPPYGITTPMAAMEGEQQMMYPHPQMMMIMPPPTQYMMTPSGMMPMMSMDQMPLPGMMDYNINDMIRDMNKKK